MKNSTLTGRWSVGRRFDGGFCQTHTLDTLVSAAGDLAQHNLALEGSEDDHAEFHWFMISLVQRGVDISFGLPFTLTSPVPCPIRPSEDSRRS